MTQIEKIKHKVDPPKFMRSLPRELKSEEYPNVIYPTKGSVFVHIYRTRDMDQKIYQAIEPELDEHAKKKYEQLSKIILKKITEKPSAVTDDELKKLFTEFVDEFIEVDEKAVEYIEEKTSRFKIIKTPKIKATSQQKKSILYRLIRDQIGGGPLEPFMRDPYLEDIHVITGDPVHAIHKIFDMIKTSVEISKEEGEPFSRKLSEKMGAPVSEAQPIVDGVMPDGSRGNLIFPKSVSIKGPSLTIRKFAETPISITKLIN